MIYAYVGAILVAAILIVLAALAIAMLTKAVGYGIRRRTVALMEIYDEQLEQRALAFQEQQEHARETSATETVVSAPEESCPAARSAGAGMELVSRLAETQYRDGSMGEVYRQIRGGFRFTIEEALQRVSEERRAGNSGAAYRAAQTLGTDDVCAMASLTPQQQYELLYSCGNEDINKMLEDYTEKTTVFSCIGFYEYIHQRAAEEARGCTLYVAPGVVPKDVPENIDVRNDPGLCEGFLLEDAGTVYDYSLRVREIS